MHVEVNGTRLWFDVDGPALVVDGAEMRQRPTVVMLHGGPAYDHSYFKPDFGRLSNVAQVVYLDMRGYGRSAQDDPASWSLEVWADDLRTFCDTLGIAKPVVFGHSFGGYVAIVYGGRHPGHAGGLVLQSTTARFDLARVAEGFRRAGGDAAAEIAERGYGGDPSVTDEEWARIGPLFGSWVPGEEVRARRVINEEVLEPGMEMIRTLDVREHLAQIDCPTLVCVGELDPMTQVADAREIVDGLADGLGHLEVIGGAGHFPWKDVPDRYWSVVEDFATVTAARA